MPHFAAYSEVPNRGADVKSTGRLNKRRRGEYTFAVSVESGTEYDRELKPRVIASLQTH